LCNDSEDSGEGKGMLIVKNTYGKSAVFIPQAEMGKLIGEFGGSSLTRKKYPKKQRSIIEEAIKKPLVPREKKRKLRSMSPRTKSKIRRKLIAFAQLQQKLTFLTLTFCNEVEDSKAVQVLANFLENVSKSKPNFQYLWVAEKQSKNKVFENNIHFHIISNQTFKIEKWWSYWLDLQAKHGITPRDENYKPSSAFDIKAVRGSNIKGVVNYLTKYVTKNASQFSCQVWNCSKGISQLYTDFYTGIEFIRQLERLQEAGQLGGKLKTIFKEWCNIHLVPLNRTTLPFYAKINEKNKTIWKIKEAAL
jgi:hypothetical protein